MSKANKELLSGIYKLAKTGIEATKAVLPKTEGEELKHELNEQLCDYSDAAAWAEKEIIKDGSLPKDLNVFEKAMMWGSIQLHTLTEVSPEHIAEIMINGTTMGIVDLSKHLGTCKDADEHIYKYAEDFIKKEEHHIENLKVFLRTFSPGGGTPAGNSQGRSLRSL